VPPAGAGTRLRRLADDWQLDLVWSVRSGAPFSVTTTQTLDSSVYTVRPDLVPGEAVWIDDPTSPDRRRLNPAAFVAPQEPRQGTLGRNTLRASPLRQVDLAVSRSISLAGHGALRLRVDAFNVLNVSNIGTPRYVLQGPKLSGGPYQTYANALGTGTLQYGGLTPLQQQGGPRSIQLGLRFDF